MVWSSPDGFLRLSTFSTLCERIPQYHNQGRVKDTQYKEEIQEYLRFSAIRIQYKELDYALA